MVVQSWDDRLQGPGKSPGRWGLSKLHRVTESITVQLCLWMDSIKQYSYFKKILSKIGNSSSNPYFLTSIVGLSQLLSGHADSFSWLSIIFFFSLWSEIKTCFTSSKLFFNRGSQLSNVNFKVIFNTQTSQDGFIW